MSEKNKQAQSSEYDIELPQSIIDSFARFLVPELRKFYESDEGQKEFEEWKSQQAILEENG